MTIRSNLPYVLNTIQNMTFLSHRNECCSVASHVYVNENTNDFLYWMRQQRKHLFTFYFLSSFLHLVLHCRRLIPIWCITIPHSSRLFYANLCFNSRSITQGRISAQRSGLCTWILHCFFKREIECVFFTLKWQNYIFRYKIMTWSIYFFISLVLLYVIIY